MLLAALETVVSRFEVDVLALMATGAEASDSEKLSYPVDMVCEKFSSPPSPPEPPSPSISLKPEQFPPNVLNTIITARITSAILIIFPSPLPELPELLEDECPLLWEPPKRLPIRLGAEFEELLLLPPAAFDAMPLMTAPIISVPSPRSS